MSSAAVKQIIYEHFEKDGTVERLRGEGQKLGQEKAKRETAFEMLRRGFQVEEVADIVKMPLEWVKDLMN